MLTAIIIAIVTALIVSLIKAAVNSGSSKNSGFPNQPSVIYQKTGNSGQDSLPMYLSKNNRQTGPHSTEQILAWLNNGQILPSDLAIRKGESQWQPLHSMFSKAAQTAFSSASVNGKTSGSKTLLFVLLGTGALILFGFIGLAALVKINKKPALSSFTNNSKVSNSSVTNTNSSNSNSATNYDSGKYNELLGKKDELLKSSFPLKSVTNPIIKGKVFIVESDDSGDTHEDSYKYNSEFGFAQIRLAKSLDEIETLIQIVCKKGGLYGNYDNGGKGYTNVCKVTINDFKAKTAITQKSFTNGTRQYYVESYKFDANDNYINPRPIAQIYQYISGITMEKALSMDVEELGRLSFSLKLNPSAKISGKYAVVAKYPTLDGIPEYSRYESFGLSSENKASKPEELDTLIQVNCQRGSQIGKKLKTTFYSNKCVVNLIDFKTLQIFAQKTIENRKMDADAIGDDEAASEVVDIPSSEIKEYLETFVNDENNLRSNEGQIK